MSGGGGSSSNFGIPQLGEAYSQLANQAYNPVPYPNVQSTESTLLGNIGNLNAYGANSTQQAGVNQPWQPDYFSTGGQQYGAFVGQGNDLYNAATAQNPYLRQQAQSVVNQTTPYAQQALLAGFDPQSKLYGKLFQQNQDQARAENAASGVATTPYGAGLVQQSDQDFNLAWQQQQLARQAQAAQTAGSLYGAGTSAIGQNYGLANQAQGIGNNALQGLYGLGSQAQQGLYGLGQSAAGQNIGAQEFGQQQAQQAQQFGQQQNLATQQQRIQDYLNYLASNQANSANWINAQLGALSGTTGLYGTQGQLQNQQNQQLGGALGGLGSLAGGLGGAYLNSQNLYL